MSAAATYMPLIEAALTGRFEMQRPRAVIFRRVELWQDAQLTFVAAFSEARLAHDFCSMMESDEFTWVLCEIHPAGDTYAMGVTTEWRGGERVKRIHP